MLQCTPRRPSAGPVRRNPRPLAACPPRRAQSRRSSHKGGGAGRHGVAARRAGGAGWRKYHGGDRRQPGQAGHRLHRPAAAALARQVGGGVGGGGGGGAHMGCTLGQRAGGGGSVGASAAAGKRGVPRSPLASSSACDGSSSSNRYCRYVPMFGDLDYDPTMGYAAASFEEQLEALAAAVAAGKVRGSRGSWVARWLAAPPGWNAALRTATRAPVRAKLAHATAGMRQPTRPPVVPCCIPARCGTWG